MLTEDLYSAISNMASSIDAMLESHERNTSNSVDSLCDSIDKLCKTVTDGKGTAGAETVLGLIAGALAGETDKIEKGASVLAASIKDVSATLDEIGKSSDNIVESTKNISKSMQYLSDGIESVGLKTLLSAYVAKVAFPAISAFTISAVDLFKSIASKEKDLTSAEKGVSALNSSIDKIKEVAYHAILGGIASIPGIAALVPMSLFVIGSSAVFMLANKLFNAKQMKETGEAIASLSKGIIDLSWAAFAVTVASPFFITGTLALVPMTVFVLGVAEVNTLVEKLFGDKKKKDYSAIGSMAKGILYMTLAAGAAIIAAPLALLAIPCVLVLGLFTLAVGSLVISPVNKLVSGKEFKNFRSGVLTMALGVLTMGLVATASIVLAPVMLLGSVCMLATYVFVKSSGLVFKEAAKNTNNYIKGTIGLVIMGAGLLATTFLLAQTVKVGKDLLTFDTLGVLAVVGAASYGGIKVMKVAGKAVGSVMKGAIAVLMVAGTVYGAAYLFNKAVTECKELISNPEDTMEGLLALTAAVGVMGTAIAAAGFALPFILPGAAAVTLVSGTVFAAAKAIGSASDAWQKAQEGGAFEIGSDGSTPFSATVKSVIGSMIDAVKDIDDIEKLGDAIRAIMPVSDFVQKLAVGVSEFSKIAMMKGEIADSEGRKMPFNLTKVGEGISAVCGSIITGISDAMKSFDFNDDNMIEISSGGFLGFGKTTTKVPKQIAAIRHLMPLATFVASLASGVSEFSKLAAMKGDITTVDADGKQITRPFNLQDVGTGISAVITALMSGISQGMEELEGGGMVEISSGGFLGIGADKISVPARLAGLQHIAPLASFISSTAELISAIGKDKDGNALSANPEIIGSIFTGLINAVNVKNIDDILEDAGEGLDEFADPLKKFCNAGWKNLPDEEGVKSFTSLIEYCTKIDASKAAQLSTGASAITNLATALSGRTSITGDDVKATSEGIEKTINAVNGLDTNKAKALADVYESMAKAASKRSNALKEVVKAIKESTEALVSAVDNAGAKVNEASSQNTQSSIFQTVYKEKEEPVKETKKEVAPEIASLPRQKVQVDLTINGQSGDQWIIRRK